MENLDKLKEKIRIIGNKFAWSENERDAVLKIYKDSGFDVNKEVANQLKSARDTLVLATLIDKTNTCAKEVDACDSVLKTVIKNYRP